MPTYTPTRPATLQPATEYELVALPNGNLLLVPFAGASVELTLTRKDNNEMSRMSEIHALEDAPAGNAYWKRRALAAEKRAELAEDKVAKLETTIRLLGGTVTHLAPATNAEGGQQEADQ